MALCEGGDSVFAEQQVFGFVFRSASFKSGAVILNVWRQFLHVGRSQESLHNEVAAKDFLKKMKLLL